MLRLAMAALLVVSVPACSTREPALSDAGSMAQGPRDAAWDYLPRPDVGPAGRDGGSPDLLDASHESRGDAGWVRMEGFTDECPIERATHPERLFAVRWLPCTDGLDDGCERMAPLEGLQMAVSDDRGWRGLESGYFVLVFGVSQQDTFRSVAIVATEGGPIAAWRAPTQLANAACRVSDVAIGDGFGAVELDYFHATGNQYTRLLHAPLAEIGAATEPIYTWTKGEPTLGSIQRMGTSSTTVGAEVQPGGSLLIAEPAGSALVPFDAASGVLGIAQKAIVVGSTVLSESWGRKVRVVRVRRGEAPQVLIEAADADVKSFDTDGVDMAWLQGSPVGPSFDHTTVELWTAKYAETAADVAARRVAAVDSRVEARVGAGLFARRFDKSTLEVFELDTGARHEFVPPHAGVIVADPLYVTADEILVPASVRDSELLRLKTAMVLAH